MSILEVVLLATSGVLGVLLVVVTSLWGGAKRRVRSLERRLSEQTRSDGQPRRPRLTVPTPSDAVRSAVGTAIKVRDEGFGAALRGSIADLARWADVERPDLVRMADADGTVTILFSDIEDSTALNHRLGDRAWVQLLGAHDRVVQKAVALHQGYVVKSQGDGFMVAFSEPTQAVAAAFEVQRRIAAARKGSKLGGIRVRIGAHRGSSVHRDNDLFGRNVAMAARIAAQADGAEVLVSDAVLERLDGDVVEVAETRTVSLKGIPGEHDVHVLVWDA